jgi:hypothetical protein
MPGRIQRQVRRCLIAAHGNPVYFDQLVEWSYFGRHVRRAPIYRALKKYAVNVGYGKWAPNADLAECISPKKR